MALAFIEALQNTLLDQVTAQIDAGAGAGVINIYNGTQPAKGGAVTTLLASLTMAATSFPAAAAATMSANAITGDSAADATGVATWFRITDSAGNFVMDGTAGATSSGADMELVTTSINAGVAVGISSFVINAGNS